MNEQPPTQSKLIYTETKLLVVGAMIFQIIGLFLLLYFIKEQMTQPFNIFAPDPALLFFGFLLLIVLTTLPITIKDFLSSNHQKDGIIENIKLWLLIGGPALNGTLKFVSDPTSYNLGTTASLMAKNLKSGQRITIHYKPNTKKVTKIFVAT